MGNRFHSERYPEWSPKWSQGGFPTWLKRIWNKRARAIFRDEKSKVRDWDSAIFTDPRRAGNWWEWY